jgi:hypothetical protein
VKYGHVHPQRPEHKHGGIKTSNPHRSMEDLDGAAVSALQRVIAQVKQRWVTENLLSHASACFGRHVKPLVSAAFAVVSTHQPVLVPRGGLWARSLYV